MAQKKGGGGQNENFDPNTGKYVKTPGSKNSKNYLSRMNAAKMSAQEIENHRIDDTINMPYFENEYLPFLNEKIKELGGYGCYSLNDEIPFLGKLSEARKNDYDKQGIDYILLLGKSHKGVDLKSIQPYKGGKADFITIAINVWTDRINAQENKCFIKDNSTDFYVFQRLVDKDSNSNSDCFILSKKDLQENIYNDYFSQYGKDFKDCMNRLKSEFDNAKQVALSKGELQDKSFRVYTNIGDNRVSKISKKFYNKNSGISLTVSMKIEYDKNGNPRTNLVLLPHSMYLKMMGVTLSKEEYNEQQAMRLFGGK